MGIEQENQYYDDTSTDTEDPVDEAALAEENDVGAYISPPSPQPYAQTVPQQEDIPSTDNTPQDPDMLEAFHQQENAKNVPYGPPTRTGERAKGPMQFMQATFDQYAQEGENVFNETDAKRVSQRYLTHLYEKYGDMKLAAAAYNAGEGAVDRFKAKTENGTWDEVSAEMSKYPGYMQTVDYVPGVLGKYESLKGKQSQWISNRKAQIQNQAQTNPQVTMGNIDEFKAAFGNVLEDPAFQTGSPFEQIQYINNIVKQKEWSPDTYEFVKKAATTIWDGARPDQQLDMSQIIGTPPVTPSNEDPTKVTTKWSNDAGWQVADAGINPALLGNQFDTYIKEASDSEINAHKLRNQSTIGYTMDLGLGSTKQIAKGGLNTLTSIDAGITREAGSLINPETANELADTIDALPSKVFGTAIDNGFYKVDPETKRIFKNADGTPQQMWQADALEAIGSVGTFIVGGLFAVSRGASAKTVSQLGLAANTFSFANSIFNHVYDQTGDVQKAYGASAFAIPAAALQTTGQLGVISGAFRPSLQSLSKYDLARFMASNFARNAGIEGVAGVLSDAVSQTGVNLATGEGYSGEQLLTSGLTNAIGGAVPGLFFDYHGEPAAFKAKQAARSKQQESAATHLSDFRNSLDQERIIPSDRGDISDDALSFMGLVVKGSTSEGTVVTKAKDISNPTVTVEDLPAVLDAIDNTVTPDDLDKLTLIQSRLIEKSKTEIMTLDDKAELDLVNQNIQKAQSSHYLYDVQKNENALLEIEKQSPGSSFFRRDNENNVWYDVRNGRRARYVKDLMQTPEAEATAQYDQDVSDVSNLDILDEDVFNATQNPQERIDAIDKAFKDQKIAQEDLGTKIAQAKQELARSSAVEDVNAQIKAIDDEIGTIKNTEPVKASTEQSDKSRIDLNKQQAKSKLLRNRLENAKSNQKKAALKRTLKDSIQKERELSAQLKTLKESVTKERANNKEAERFAKLNETKKELQSRLSEQDAALNKTDIEGRVKSLEDTLGQSKQQKESLKEQQKQHKKELSEYNKLKKRLEDTKKEGGLGRRKGNTLDLLSAKTPEAKQQKYAHEVAHVVQDKLKLPEDVKGAIKKAVDSAYGRQQVTNATDLAKELWLPTTIEETTIPPDTLGSKLTKAAKEYLFDPREFEANQIAAVMLKRRGADIGDYKIVPELEAHLERVKLPELPGKASAESKQEGVRAEQDTNRTQESGTEGRKSPPEDTEFTIDPRTGERYETAFSKSVREEAPETAPVMRDKVSRIKSRTEADLLVENQGFDKTYEYLTSEDAKYQDPTEIQPITDALLAKADKEFSENPNQETQKNLYKAQQLRALAPVSEAAQVMALARRFRNTDSFAQFIGNLRDALREGGVAPEEFTDYMLKELKAIHERLRKVPETQHNNYYKNRLAADAFVKALKSSKTDWLKYYNAALKSNIISGIGTSWVNAFGGAYLGPVFTALRHPILGGGMVWGAVRGHLKLGKVNYELNLKDPLLVDNAALNLSRLSEDNSPLYIPVRVIENQKAGSVEKIAEATAMVYEKYHKFFVKRLGSVDAFMRTLSNNAYLHTEKYVQLKKQYGNDVNKFTAEVAKLQINPKDIEAAKIKAADEAKAIGLDVSESEIYKRAFEILQEQRFVPEEVTQAGNWADVLSLRGEYGSPLLRLVGKAFSSSVWQNYPEPAFVVKTLIFPFHRAMLSLADVALDHIPGYEFAERGYIKARKLYETRKTDPKVLKERGSKVIERPEHLKQRLRTGNIIGSTVAAGLLAAVQTGLIEITGEAEQVLDRGGEGDNKGKRARTAEQFREFQQLGKPDYSIIFPGGTYVKYKDIPGLNAIAYGIHKMNKSLEAGADLMSATGQFYLGAFKAAAPIIGISAINSPYIKLADTLMAPEYDGNRTEKALNNIVKDFAKRNIPGSALLRDVKELYDETPEASGQGMMTDLVSQYPVTSEMMGSKPMLNRYGTPVVHSVYDRLSKGTGMERIAGVVKEPSDPVDIKLREKGLILPELRTTVKFNKSDFPNETAQNKYRATREERLSKAASDTFTPDEWYQFVKETGPYVKRVANQIASSGLPQAEAQQELLKQVKAIESEAKKRYIVSGSFK